MIWLASQPAPLCPLCISNPSVSRSTAFTNTHTHNRATVMPTDAHTETQRHIEATKFHIKMLTHARTHFTAAVSISTLANQQRGFITHQISFRFAMKDQFIKNALNMSGFS